MAARDNKKTLQYPWGEYPLGPGALNLHPFTRRPSDSYVGGPLSGGIPVLPEKPYGGITPEERAAARRIAGLPPVAPPNGKSKMFNRLQAISNAAKGIRTDGDDGGGKTDTEKSTDTFATQPPFAFSTQEELRQKALAGLQGDIESARQEFATTLAAQRAENKANREILARYGQAVNAYLTDAATRAGRDFETQAATQAILGAVGQGALQNRPMGTIFASPRPELGNAPLMTALGAQEAEQGAAIGATLNQLLGTDAASRLLSEARGAQQSALASAASEGATGQRLLSSLLKTQGATISDLLSKKQQFEAKVPSLISQRMQDLADAELQNYYKSQALGLQQNRFSLDVAKEARLSAKDAAAESRQGKLSETKLAEYRKKAAEDAIALANGQSTNVYEIINRKTGERRLKGQTSTKSPITNYQQAYKIMYSKYGDILTTREILDKLNSVPIWSTPGQSGRPYIDILFRNLIKDKTDIPDALVERAAFDPNAAEEVSRRYNEFRFAYGG